MSGPSLREPETISTRTADGVRLDATVWRPAGPGRHPVLLMRQAYGRAVASSVVLAHPAWYAAQGYVVMVQDVRGTGTSEGGFAFLGTDVEDGAEALAVAADLAGGTGDVAMYGFSYQGIDQFLALAGARARGGPVPKALIPAMASWSVRDHLVWEGGAIRLGLMGLALQYAVTQAERAGDVDAFTALRAAGKALPLAEAFTARPAVLDRFGRYAPWADWLADDPAYWAARSPADRLDRIGIPTLLIGGQMDALVDGTLASHAVLSAEGTPHGLIHGPWGHIPWGRRAGVDLGAEAAFDVDAASLAWLDRHMKGREVAGPGLHVFDLGTRVWRRLDRYPGDERLTLHLASDGLAGTRSDRGALGDPPARAVTDRIVHDPWRPVPALGGHLGEGMVDRAALDERADVAVYTSRPFEAPVTVAGPAEVVLTVAADRPSFDLAVALSLVSADGAAAMTLSTGFLRVRPGQEAPFRIALRPILVTVRAGLRLRLSIAGAAWPAFTVNPGTGAPDADHRLIDATPITLAISSGPDVEAVVILPTIAAARDPFAMPASAGP